MKRLSCTQLYAARISWCTDAVSLPLAIDDQDKSPVVGKICWKWFTNLLFKSKSMEMFLVFISLEKQMNCC